MTVPDILMSKYGLALAIVAVTLLYKGYVMFMDRRRYLGLGGVIPYNRRHLVEPVHGQRVELSPAEAVCAKAAMEFHGAMRITVVALLTGPVPQSSTVQRALWRLQAAHPFLRCTFKEAQLGLLKGLVAEVDDRLVIPVRKEHLEDVTLETAWRQVHSKEEKMSLKLGDPLARVTIVSAGQPCERSVELNEPEPTFALLLSCEHAICDGVSLSVLSHELFVSMAEEASETPYAPVRQYWAPALETACNLPGIRGTLRWLYRVAMFFPLPRPNGCAKFPVPDPSLMPKHMTQHFATRKQYTDLSLAATARLLLLCHSRHTTVTGAISAATVVALAKVINQSKHVNKDALAALGAKYVKDNQPSSTGATRGIPICLSYFADMRYHFWPPISPSCLCFNVSLMPPYKDIVDLSDPKGDTAESMWRMSYKVRHGIEAGFRAEYMNLVGGVMSAVLDAALYSPDLGGLTVTAAVSNGGMAPKADGYGPWKLVRVRPIVNTSFARYPTVLVETAAGHLTMTLLSPETYIDDEDMNNLGRELTQCIATLLGNGKISQSSDGAVTYVDV